MKLKKYGSDVLIDIPINRYRVKWRGPCRSKFQAQVKQWLEPYWRTHICVEEMPIPGTLYRCDLVNLTRKIIVETSGKQHVEHVKFFHGQNRFNLLGQVQRDEAKRAWAAANDFLFVEIYDEDLPLTKQFFKDRYDIDL